MPRRIGSERLEGDLRCGLRDGRCGTEWTIRDSSGTAKERHPLQQIATFWEVFET